MPLIVVVIPSFQEGKRITQTLDDLLPMGHQLVLVDDGSSDDTRDRVADYPVHYVPHPINLGQGAALQTGMTYALDLGADYVVHFDADGQHRAADLPALLAPLLAGQADISLGSRFLPGSQAEGLNPWRKWLLRAAILVNGLMTGLWLTDAHCGLRALSRTACEAISLQQAGMAHATEMLLAIRQARLRYVEVPVQIHYDAYSRAKGQSGWQAFHILGDLLGW